MGNAPDPVSDEALALLRGITAESWGRGIRPRRSPARDELKRRGLILSRPPNYLAGSRGVGGHGHFWLPTKAGRAFLEYYGECANG